MDRKKRIRIAAASLGLSIAVFLLVSCGATIRPTVASGYDWTKVEKICVIGISELRQSPEISRGLTHQLFEGGFPVVRRDARSVLDIYEIARREGADVIAYGTLSKVEIYYGYGRHYEQHGAFYPTKEVEIELQFIEAETRRRIWQGTGSLEDNATVADEFIVDKLLSEMVAEILPQWAELPRASASISMLRLGDTAPLFEAREVNGALYSLEDVVGDKVVVLSFWSLFCEQCKQKMRLLNDVHHDYDAKDVEIIAISLEGEAMSDRIKSHIEHEGLDFTFLLDEQADGAYRVADSYKVPAVPALYIIGKSGKIAFARSGHVTASELSAALDSELAKR